ncbi:MAG: hypothetical protein ACOX4H_02875 [Bacillota bacterium]|jgi:hypothetical protein
MESATNFNITLIIIGFLVVPIMGILLERRVNARIRFGIIGILLGSAISLAGFAKCISWGCICSAFGNCTACIILLIAWITFLFLSLTVYTTQLKR